MKKIWEAIKAFMVREWTLEEKILIMLCCVLFGVIKGFLCSPLKKGISIASGNGNHYVFEEDMEDEEEEE